MLCWGGTGDAGPEGGREGGRGGGGLNRERGEGGREDVGTCWVTSASTRAKKSVLRG